MAIRPISVDELHKLGIDLETNRLYWDSQEIVTVFALPYWGQVAIFVTAGATAIMALSMVTPQVILLVKYLKGRWKHAGDS